METLFWDLMDIKATAAEIQDNLDFLGTRWSDL